MNKKLSRKNAQGKWWTYGNIKINQWGNEQASFKVSSLQELIQLAESEGKEWVNLSLFDDEQKDKQQVGSAKNTQTTYEDLNDDIPF